MNNYKFRGKVKYNRNHFHFVEWVEGYYWKDEVSELHYIKYTEYDGMGFGTACRVVDVEVIPETVGQFTGLYDCTKWEDLTEDQRSEWTRAGNIPYEWKGREIYEGDTVVVDGEYPYFDNGKKNYIGIIEWVFSGWQPVLKCINNEKRGISDGINDGYLEEDGFYRVIGNIHDNE